MSALKCRIAIHLGLGSLSYVKLARDMGEAWRVSSYGELEWEGQSGPSDIQQDHLEAATKRLAIQQGLNRESVHISLHSRYCVSRVATGSRQQVTAQFEQIAANSQHYLQFGLGEKLIGRSLISLGDGEHYGQVAIIKQGLFDRIDKPLERCGLRMDSVDGAMPNICRLIGQSKLDHEPLLMVWLTESSAEIGISYKGRLQLSYQLGGVTGPQAVAETIRKHLKRLRRFCDRYRSVNGEVKLNHLMILASRQLAQALRAELEGTVFDEVSTLDDFFRDQLANRFVLDEQLPSVGVAAALGGLLVEVEPDVMPFTDVLEKYSQRKPRNLSSILLLDALPVYVAAMLLIAITGWSFWLQSQISAAQERTIEWELSLAAEREQMLQLDGLREEIKHIEQLIQQIHRPPEHELVASIAACMAGDQRLETFAIEDTGKVILTGTMIHGDQSFELLQMLRRSPAIQEVALESVVKSTTLGVATTMFEIHCELDDQYGLPTCTSAVAATEVQAIGDSKG